MDEQIRDRILAAQEVELTEHAVYLRLAHAAQNPANRKILEDIAADELRHAQVWERHTGKKVAPNRLRVAAYYWLSRLLGLTFGAKLMEQGEARAQIHYEDIARTIPDAAEIAHDEHHHEQQLLALIDEDFLRYLGSVVLGLNDALVELTGALAGFTLALADIRLVAVTGLITGIAASLSMAASEYLSIQAEAPEKNPLRGSLYTGLTYTFAVLLLILPYLVVNNIYLALAWALLNAVLLIAAFSFYTSVTQDRDFYRQFLGMAPLTLGVAALSFGIGFLVKVAFGLEA